MSQEYSLMVGAGGWMHPAWEESFYPEDLPSDWQLGFYANEFPVVLINNTEWGAYSSDHQTWLQDSDERLQFIARIPATSHGEDWLEKIASLQERLLAILLTVHPSTGLETILAAVDRWSTLEIPLCLDFTAHRVDEKILQALSRQQIGWCWHGDGDVQGLSIGRVGIACISNAKDEPKQLRTYVQTCLAAGDENRQMVLLFAGEPPSIEAMRNAAVIRDFL